MRKISYKDIANDKENILCILELMILIYKSYKKHTQLLECEQWVLMLSRQPIQTEFTSDALLTLKNILNDAINYFACKGNIELSKNIITLIDKIIKLFSNEKD